MNTKQRVDTLRQRMGILGPPRQLSRHRMAKLKKTIESVIREMVSNDDISWFGWSYVERSIVHALNRLRADESRNDYVSLALLDRAKLVYRLVNRHESPQVWVLRIALLVENHDPPLDQWGQPRWPLEKETWPDTGATMLHTAAQYQTAWTIKTLLDMGADPNAVDVDGQTPLHLAVLDRCSSNQIEEKLTHLHAHPHARHGVKDTQGKTPLHIALEQGRFLAALTLLRLGDRVDGLDQWLPQLREFVPYVEAQVWLDAIVLEQSLPKAAPEASRQRRL